MYKNEPKISSKDFPKVNNPTISEFMATFSAWIIKSISLTGYSRKMEGPLSVIIDQLVSCLLFLNYWKEQFMFRLKNILGENNILYDFQSGFRGSFSTDTCLIHLSDHIRTQMSLGNYTGMVLLDLQKAFDTVDHVILCKKLQAMGIGSVEWFQSYLSNRQQIVSVNKS